MKTFAGSTVGSNIYRVSLKYEMMTFKNGGGEFYNNWVDFHSKGLYTRLRMELFKMYLHQSPPIVGGLSKLTN